MKVKMILPALTEATSPFLRPIKYSLFPPLGLPPWPVIWTTTTRSTCKTSMSKNSTSDDKPDLVVIQVYITSAYRAYALADHYRRARRVRLPRRAARHLAAPRSRGARRFDFPWPRRRYLAAIPQRFPRRATAQDVYTSTVTHADRNFHRSGAT